jgi:hypothetical protein
MESVTATSGRSRSNTHPRHTLHDHLLRTNQKDDQLRIYRPPGECILSYLMNHRHVSVRDGYFPKVIARQTVTE